MTQDEFFAVLSNSTEFAGTLLQTMNERILGDREQNDQRARERTIQGKVSFSLTPPTYEIMCEFCSAQVPLAAEGLAEEPAPQAREFAARACEKLPRASPSVGRENWGRKGQKTLRIGFQRAASLVFERVGAGLGTPSPSTCGISNPSLRGTGSRKEACIVARIEDTEKNL